MLYTAEPTKMPKRSCSRSHYGRQKSVSFHSPLISPDGLRSSVKASLHSLSGLLTTALGVMHRSGDRQHYGAAWKASGVTVLRFRSLAAGSDALRPSEVLCITTVIVVGLLALLPTALANTSQNKHTDGRKAPQGLSVQGYDARPPCQRTPPAVAPPQGSVVLQGAKARVRQGTQNPTFRMVEQGTPEGAAGLDKGLTGHGRVLQGGGASSGEGADTISIQENEISTPGGGRGGSWWKKMAAKINYHGRRMLAVVFNSKPNAAEATVHTAVVAVLPRPDSVVKSSLAAVNDTLALNDSAVVQAAYTRRTDAGGVAIVATVDVPPEAFRSAAAGAGAASAADALGVTTVTADGSEVMMVNITVTVSVAVPVKVTALPPAVPDATSTGAGAGAGATAAAEGEDLQQATHTMPVTPGHTAKSFIAYLLGHAPRPGVQGPLQAIPGPRPAGQGGSGRHHRRRLQATSRAGGNTAIMQKPRAPTSRTPHANIGQRPVHVPLQNYSSLPGNRTAAEGST